MISTGHANNDISGDERILKDPAPVVLVIGLGDSSVNLQPRFWTEGPHHKYTLMWEYIEKCKKFLEKADIEFFFPLLQLFLEKTKVLEAFACPTKRN